MDIKMDVTFESLVREYVNEPYYLERPWLIQAVETAIADPACRFALLVAPPGAGKTAFAAGLAARRPDWIRYFIRRDQRTRLSDTGAVPFLLRVGYQLAWFYPELFLPEDSTLRTLGVDIKSDVQVNFLAPGSKVVGIHIGRFHGSPFQKFVHELRQSERQAGGIYGVEIGEILVDPYQMNLQNLQYSALLEVSAALSEVNPDQRLVIIVDAVDELRYSEGHETLLDWCSACPELPPNLRFVLTSRPDDELLAPLRQRQAPWLREVAIDTQSCEVGGDLYRYAAGRAVEESIIRAVADQSVQLEAFLQAVVASAAGNLGYVAALFNEIQAAIAARDDQRLALLLQLKVLPCGLESLYAFFLRRIKVSVARECIELNDPDTGETYVEAVWPTVYHPILGALAVAMEPLDLELIERLGGIRAERVWVSEALERLGQLLMHIGNHYSLYHHTLADFLTSARTREQPEYADLFVDPIIWHSRICSTILAKMGL
jgi:hypothetical protein